MRISDWSSDVCSSDLDYRLGLHDDLAAAVGNVVDQIGWNAVAAISENRKAACQLQRRDAAGAQRQGQHGRLAFAVEAEAGDEVLNVLGPHGRSEEHTSELQSLMRISYAVFCLKKKKKNRQHN